MADAIFGMLMTKQHSFTVSSWLEPSNLPPFKREQKSYCFGGGVLKLLTGVSFKAVTFLPPHLELEESP